MKFARFERGLIIAAILRQGLCRIGLIATLIFLGACSANYHTAFRLKHLDDTRAIVAVDAKQRAIVFGSDRSCSEPSPDVYSVIAQALSAGGSLKKSADPAALEAALKLAFSSAEQGTTIPRTQTVNMLRELMYRTCERYLNGGIDTGELAIQAVRDQRLMVSILAIEQLTGAVVPTAVSVGATASAGEGSADAIVRLDDALKEVDASAAAATKAKADYDQQTGTDKKCEAIVKAVAEGTDLTDEQKAQQKPCADTLTAKSTAEQRETRAKQHYSELQQLAAGVSGPTSTETDAGGTGELARAHTEALAALAPVVRDIVFRNFSDRSEALMFCLRQMAPDSAKKTTAALTDDKRSELVKDCATFFQTLVNTETAGLAEQQTQSLRNMTTVIGGLFDQVWPSLETTLRTAQSRQQFVEGLKNKLLASEATKAQCFSNATSKEAARICFTDLPSQLQRSLLEGR